MHVKRRPLKLSHLGGQSLRVGTYVEGCGDLWTEGDGDVLDPRMDRGEVEGNHLCGVRIVERAIETVSSDPKAEAVGDARSKVC
jgi:hypothetical protein